jgi:hypothetical protein
MQKSELENFVCAQRSVAGYLLYTLKIQWLKSKDSPQMQALRHQLPASEIMMGISVVIHAFIKLHPMRTEL